MKNQESTSSLRNTISLYFDNALSQEECNSLMDKVSNDSRCHKEFKKEESFRNFIKDNVKRSPVSPGLIQSIKDSTKIV